MRRVKRIDLNRRMLLRGMGTAVALPLMEAMLPSTSKASALPQPKRLGIFYTPNGVSMDNYTPTKPGRDYDLTPVLEPLAPWRDEFIVISGLGHPKANPPGGGHGRSCPTFLTGARARETEGSDIQCGISMDQVVANHFRNDTQLPSLELGIEPPSLLGSCDIGYSCTYTNTLSWRSPTVALPVTVSPSDIFERLFGDGDITDEKSRQAQIKRRASILDFIREDAARLSGRVGVSDRRKLEEYLEAIRDVERRIQKASEQQGEIDYSSFERPTGIPDSFQDHVRMMVDLQILAMQTDMTRVTTFMLGRELSNRAYPEIGVPDSHHMLSHHAGDPEKIAKLVRINRYHKEQFGYYLERLRTTADGEGTLLDSTLVLSGACIGEPNVHDNKNLPIIVAGGGLEGNRHIVVPENTSMSNLMLSMIRMLGVPQESFGDSSGALDIA